MWSRHFKPQNFTHKVLISPLNVAFKINFKLKNPTALSVAGCFYISLWKAGMNRCCLTNLVNDRLLRLFLFLLILLHNLGPPFSLLKIIVAIISLFQ